MEEIKYNKELLYKLESMCARDGLSKANKKDIAAKVLKISSQNFYEYRKRKSIPIKHIIPYCLDNHINLNWVLDSRSSLLHEIEMTKHIKRWTKCRKSLLVRIISNEEDNDDCKKLASFARYNTSNLKTDEDIYNFFFPSDRLSFDLRIKVKLWIFISFLAGLILGILIN